jgi:hypothetical protein
VTDDGKTGKAPAPLGATDEHARLLERVGVWKVACKYFMNPADEPIEAEGSDRVQALGPYWTSSAFHCDVMGSPIEGLATMGFDPGKQKYVSTWQDSSNPYFYYYEGTWDDEGKLVMEGDNIDPMTGKLVKYRSVETLSRDERTLELFIDYGKGQLRQILEYDYTRV